MPLSEPFLTIFEGAIAPACQDVGLRCGNAADIFGPGVIISEIRAQIRDARVLIADVNGRNPNVFYELGVAHEMGKTAIPISHALRMFRSTCRIAACSSTRGPTPSPPSLSAVSVATSSTTSESLSLTKAKWRRRHPGASAALRRISGSRNTGRMRRAPTRGGGPCWLH